MDATLTNGRFIEDIKQIKTKRQALVTGSKQFTDKGFPTDIGIDALNDLPIHWKRIKELEAEPQLYKDGSPINGEMEQGLIEDHPLVAVLSAIANHPKLLNYIFPSGQDFSDPGYCGLFYFRFWKMGKWVYVIVDDRIPIVGNKKADEPRKKDKSKIRDLQAADSSKFIDGEKNKEENGKEVETSKEEKKDSPKSSGVQLPQQIEGEEKLPGNEKSAANPEPAKNEVKVSDQPSTQPGANADAKPSTADPEDDTNKKPESTTGADAESSKKSLATNEPDKKTVNAEPEAIKGAHISSENTFDPKKSNAKPEDQKLPENKPESKTNETPEPAKTAESLELKHSSNRTSGSIGKTSIGSRGSNKNKEGAGANGDIDPEKALNRNNRTIFVRVFGSDGKLYYWATLLEKAYAKAYGGYSKLPKINLIETLLDLTGGATEIFYTSHLPRGFFLDFKNFSDTRSIILAATSIPAIQEEQAEPKDDSSTNLFSVTSVILADFRKSLGRDKIVGFVRLSNPYGEVKWISPWGEASQEWQVLPPLVTAKLKMEARRGGEFYLTYRNFLKAFSALIICSVPDGENFNSEGYFGEWTKPKLQYNLCRIDDLRFHEFPQHKIWARDPNSKDTEADVIISLVQNGRCCCSESPSYNATQLFLFCMDMDRSHTLPLNFEFFRYNKPIGCSNVSSEKEVTASFKLLPGHYLVVPVIDYSTTVHPCQANDYVLRVLTPAKFPKPPPPPLSTFTDSENLNIYYKLAETIEEPKNLVTVSSRDSFKSEADKAGHKEKGKGKKKKVKH